jgi:hypothetical protein
LIKPELMFPPKSAHNITGSGTNAEPTNQTADLLFRIPLWMDLSMHLLPAVALIIGKPSRPSPVLDAIADDKISSLWRKSSDRLPPLLEQLPSQRLLD